MKIVSLSAITAALLVAGSAYAQTAPAPSTTTTTTTTTTQTAAPKFSSASMIRDLLADPEAKAVLVKHIPEVVAHPSLDQALDMSLADIAEYIGGDTVVNAIGADLVLIK